MPENLHIISRFNEDLSWINNLDGSILIYNKGNDFPFDFPFKQSKNIGRETETFIRAIIETYDEISKFNYISFLQGSPREHCKNFLNIIKNYQGKTNFTDNFHDEKFYYLTDDVILYHFPKDKIINGIHHSLIARLFKKELPWQFLLSSIDGKTIDHSVLIENAMVLCHILNIDYLGSYYYWGHGAQYIVPSEMVTSKSLEWWKEFHKLTLLSYDEFNLESLGYAAEAIWPLIWKHST